MAGVYIEELELVGGSITMAEKTEKDEKPAKAKKPAAKAKSEEPEVAKASSEEVPDAPKSKPAKAKSEEPAAAKTKSVAARMLDPTSWYCLTSRETVFPTLISLDHR